MSVAPIVVLKRFDSDTTAIVRHVRWCSMRYHDHQNHHDR